MTDTQSPWTGPIEEVCCVARTCKALPLRDGTSFADSLMQLVIHPPVERERLDRIVTAAGSMTVVNAEGEEHALLHIPEADAFFGKITLRLLARAAKLRWVQAPTASLE